MTPEAEMKSLIERLEKATAGSSELDHAIALVCAGRLYDCLPYTASIDAALTLVPDHQSWLVKRDPFGVVPQLCTAEVWDDHNGAGPWIVNHDISALALCIASLKARSV